MALQLSNEWGEIHITEQTLANIAGTAALECYGLAGMASQKQIKDGIAELLGRDNLSKGVVVRQEGEQLLIELYIIVSYGTKISEVAHNIQDKVRYVLDQTLGIQVAEVHVFVQGVSVNRD